MPLQGVLQLLAVEGQDVTFPKNRNLPQSIIIEIPSGMIFLLLSDGDLLLF